MFVIPVFYCCFFTAFWLLNPQEISLGRKHFGSAGTSHRSTTVATIQLYEICQIWKQEAFVNLQWHKHAQIKTCMNISQYINKNKKTSYDWRNSPPSQARCNVDNASLSYILCPLLTFRKWPSITLGTILTRLQELTCPTHFGAAMWKKKSSTQRHGLLRQIPWILRVESMIAEWQRKPTHSLGGWTWPISYTTIDNIYMTYICHIHSQFIMTCVLVSFEGYWMMLVFHSERKLPTKAPQRIINTQSTLISTFSPSNNGYTLPQTNIDIHRPWKYAIPKGN